MRSNVNRDGRRWTSALPARMLFVITAAAMACGAFAQSQLTSVQWKKIGEGVELQIHGQSLAKPKTFWTNKDRSFLLEFEGHLLGKAGTKRVNEAGVNYVTYGWFSAKPPKVRVHVNLTPGLKPELAETEYGWSVSFGVAPAAKATAKVDAFPETVPPLDKPNALEKAIEKMAASPVLALPPTRGTNIWDRTVSLEFVGTDVVQILKALALQANVNIVTAPEVTGKLSVSLNNVNVQQALDFVTTLAGVRYALVGNTFVVTTNERFANAMRQIDGNQDVPNQTRIVGLVSGEGAQIKATVLKALPQESVLGRYDILLPTESTTLETQISEATAKAAGSEPSSSGAGEGQRVNIVSKAETGGSAIRPKDMYLVLVGLPRRLDEVEKVVREIDSRIADASKVVIGKDIDTAVVPIYSGKVSEVTGALRRVVDRDPKRELYNITESSTGGPSDADAVKLLMIAGPSDSMKSVELFAKGIDEGFCKSMGIPYPESAEAQELAFEVLDLKHVDPVEAAAELNKQVPGIRASVLPAGVRPNTKGGRKLTVGDGAEASGGGASGGAANSSLGVQGGGGPNGGLSAGIGTSGSGGSGASAGEDGFTVIRPLGTEPMKVMVRGTRGQIDQAKQFLSVFDTAPQQVSLELRVMEMTKEDALRVGIDWSALTGGAVRFIRVNQNLGGSPSTTGTVSSGTVGSSILGEQGIRFNNSTGASITATLDQIATNLKMIARPNILAMEGRPTAIFIGDEVRYVESIQASQNGLSVTVGQVNVGVKLNVTPRIGSAGNLVLDLNPELSLLKSFTDVPGGGKLPQTSLRSTSSVVSLKSGETLAIGGLIQESDRYDVGGIPILKDLPLIGQLFRRTDKHKVRSEVVFFLTATTVNSDDRQNAADPRESERKNAPEMNFKKNGKG
jgi:type II secretory pathway component GspD/PulD (secretin)